MNDTRFPFIRVAALGRALARSFAGARIAFAIGAVVTTWALVASGIDQSARDVFAEVNPFRSSESRFACLMIGMLWPLVVGLVLFRRGFYARDRELSAAGSALLQATVAIGLFTAFLKLATGRPQPEAMGAASEFHLLAFAPSRGWFMWPSGHTTESVGAVGALIGFRARRRAVALGSIGAALVVSAMLVGCFHWVSDVVAGALIALPIGHAIGASMRAWADDARA